MARTKISEFSSNPATNTDIDSIFIGEGMAPSNVNDAIRELMSQLKDWQSGTSNDPYVVGSSGSLTLNQGTANGVAYLNGSKVVTSGSALTFDGTTLTSDSGSSGLIAALKSSNTNGGYFSGYSSGTAVWDIGTAKQTMNTGGASDLGFNTRSGSMMFGINNSEQMRLTSTGLGIGTSSPAYKLDVAGVGRFVSTNTVFINPNYDTGIAAVQVSNSAGLAFATSNAERMRLDSSGNLGLGVTPSAWGSNVKAFQVTGSALSRDNSADAKMVLSNNAYRENGSVWKYIGSAAAAMYQQGYSTGDHQWFTAASGTAGNAITFTQAMTLSAAGGLSVGTTSDAGAGNIWANGRFFSGDGSASNNAYARAAGAGTGMYFPAADTLGLSTAGAERARIDSSGNLLVGTTSTGPVSANAITIEPANSRIRVAHGSTANGTPYIQFDYGGSNIGSITQNTTTSVLYNVTSDQRLKENIVNAPEFGSVIDSIQVRSFDWKENNSHQRAGFIAQELVTVAPEAVHQPEDTDEMMAVDYSKLVPMLVKEIQSLRKRLADAGL